MEEKLFTVSETVRLVGVESHVLRYWEEELQMPIQRNSQGHRAYTLDNIRTFHKVKELKNKGLQLKAIRMLFAHSDEEMDVFLENERDHLSGEPIVTETDSEAEPVSYEIIPMKKEKNQIEIFMDLLRQVMEDVSEQQNERLVEMIADQLDDTIADLLQADSWREAAVSNERKQSFRGKMRSIWENILRRRSSPPL